MRRIINLAIGSSHRKGAPNKTRKTRVNTNTTLKAKNTEESFIYLCAQGGLNDCLVQLSHILSYARKHRRSIILRMRTYDATDLSSVFDFSKFPVPIYTNFRERLAAFPAERFEPRINPMKIGKGASIVFNFHKTYSREKVLLYSNGSGGDGFPILQYIRFTPEFLNQFYMYRKKLELSREYVSMHLRATDRSITIDNNIRGITLAESNIIIKTPTASKDPRKASLEKIDRFIKKFPGVSVFVASDNPALLTSLRKKYPQIIHTDSAFRNNKHCTENKCDATHLNFGSKDKQLLKNALFDLLLLAGAKAILTSAGGFSRLAKKLQVDKELLTEMLKN
jgi:hypothetical protein